MKDQKNYVFEDNNPPQEPSGQGFPKYIFDKGSFDWKLKGLVPFLIVQSNWRVANPPFTPTISQNTSNQNLEIAILFNIIESSKNYVFEDNKPPGPLRTRVVIYALGAHKIYI